jgi:hypothetical protein
LDGKKVHVGNQDMIQLNQDTCSAYGGLEKYEAWEFPAPDSYILSKVYCNLIKAEDGNLRRNVFDCNNQKGKWGCDLIATELKYILPKPINFIFLSSTYLSDTESLEVIDKLVSNVSDKNMYHEASCNVEISENNKQLYVIQCNYRNFIEILKVCKGSSCTWTIGQSGSVFN